MKRWLWLPGLVVAVLVLTAALGARSASAQRSVPLVVGCNPVSMTYDTGTAITTVAAGVTPAGSLDSIWKYLAAEKRWIGYSPAAPPEASDLPTVERLDPLFVCVNAVGTITMPAIGGGG